MALQVDKNNSYLVEMYKGFGFKINGQSNGNYYKNGHQAYFMEADVRY